MEKPQIEIDQLKEQFEQLFQLIIEIKILSEDLIYLHPKHDNFNDLIFYSPLLQRLIEGLKTQFALRYCTFLNNKEHYNLSSYINKLIKRFDDIPFTNPIELIEIENSRNRISKIRKSNEFKAVLHIRNKYLAHIDKDRSETKLPEVYQDDIDLQIDELINIFKFIGSSLFGQTYLIELMHWDKDHTILDQLSNYYDIIELYEKIKYKTENRVIEIDEIDKIINEASH